MSQQREVNDASTGVSMERYWQEAMRSVTRLQQTQMDGLQEAARLCAACLARGGVIHTYGTGHSRAFAMELAGRAGGLVPVNRLDLEDLALRAGWSPEVVMHPDIERDLQAGKELLGCYHIEPEDLFLICSNSGGNAAIVEVAQQVKQRGHTLLAVTSLAHTHQSPARHPSGKKLYELADLVIDNQAPFGDALLALPDGSTACAISSVTGALIAQMLTAGIIALLLEQGLEAPVYLSANVPGGMERNNRLVQHYADRIRPV